MILSVIKIGIYAGLKPSVWKQLDQSLDLGDVLSVSSPRVLPERKDDAEFHEGTSESVLEVMRRG